MFTEVIKNYAEYISREYHEKLHAGELLANAARILLKIDTEKLDNSAALQREYFMWHIAQDLLKQVMNMGNTKQYDSVPVLKEYTYLAFDLAFDYCEWKADRHLLPFLTSVIYYEEYEENKEYLNKLISINKQSIVLEKKYADHLIAREHTNH